jgi:hypothetical protein
MPAKQCNDNGAYTLLAFAGVDAETPWENASSPRLKPHDVLSFSRERYGKAYAENTRETIRRQAIHQFVQGGILIRNPDEPELSTNSPRTHYALSEAALAVIRAYGTDDFDAQAGRFLHALEGGLVEKHASRRRRAHIPVRLPSGSSIDLSPGAHNKLQRDIIELFVPNFAPGSKLLYLGDSANKQLIVDRDTLAALRVTLNQHDKLPDIILYDEVRQWLFLVEAVTSHGPMSPKRQQELLDGLKDIQVGLVFVSAFQDFREFNRHSGAIAWDTEAWIAERPEHMIHFNGDRFLGPRR